MRRRVSQISDLLFRGDNNNQALIDAITAVMASQNITSGSWTPSLFTVGSNNVSAATAFDCSYIRVGNVVAFAGQISVTATTANTNTNIQISLPIASNFSSADQAAGSGVSYTAGDRNVMALQSDSATDRINLRMYPSVNTSVAYRFSGQYRIL